MGVSLLPVMRHDQRPGGERHQLPGEQEGEGVVREDNQRHAGEEGGKERDDATRVRFVASVADGVEARACSTQADEHQERRREGVKPEVDANPRQTERQFHPGHVGAERNDPNHQQHDTDNAARRVNQRTGLADPRGDHAQGRQSEQCGDAIRGRLDHARIMSGGIALQWFRASGEIRFAARPD